MYLEIQNLSKTISKNPILRNITIGMERGKIYGLRGKNGSGKTMLMRAICGLILPTEGSVSIDGEVLGKDISFPRSIGALIENPVFIANYSGLKNLQILAAIQNHIGQKDIEAIMEQLGLDSA
ncbi:MAG: ATP-binding cassette domain-containing protein, partial [[Clostridium] leptum]